MPEPAPPPLSPTPPERRAEPAAPETVRLGAAGPFMVETLIGAAAVRELHAIAGEIAALRRDLTPSIVPQAGAHGEDRLTTVVRGLEDDVHAVMRHAATLSGMETADSTALKRTVEEGMGAIFKLCARQDAAVLQVARLADALVRIEAGIGRFAAALREFAAAHGEAGRFASELLPDLPAPKLLSELAPASHEKEGERGP